MLKKLILKKSNFEKEAWHKPRNSEKLFWKRVLHFSSSQIGPVLGVNHGWMYKVECDNSNPPVVPMCKGAWMYYDKEWKADKTVTLTCKGKKLF